MKVMLFSFVLDAQLGFEAGVVRLIAKLAQLGIVEEKKGALPTRKAYNDACAKLPVPIIRQMFRKSHEDEYEANGRTFHGLKVLIPDGTKISMTSTQETKEKYGEGQGHYVQTQALGFYELTTGTFEDFRLEHSKTAERAIALDHMRSNKTRSLYLADAGYNGMAFCAICIEKQHDLLMQLKNCALVRKFLKTKRRSANVEVKLTKNHLKNYPDHQHLLGKSITMRLVRTRGTSKLKSQALITTLIDSKTFSWQELTKLYLQRYTVELAFRHLKTKIRIEKIRKQKLHRIEQLMSAAIALYNISAVLRNRIRKPDLLPVKAGTKLHCFTLCIELVDVFFQAALHRVYGIKKRMDLCLRAIRGCWFIYKPWRAEPRICRTPPSEFSVYKGAKVLEEVQKAEFLRVEYEILAQQYGQKAPADA